MRQPYSTVKPYITKDGSKIRELMHPHLQGNKNQSLAEATLPVGGKTLLHKHLDTEELYHITQGQGMIYVGGEHFQVDVGDTVCITPQFEHYIENIGKLPLIFLCCCSPAYSHKDTILIND